MRGVPGSTARSGLLGVLVFVCGWSLMTLEMLGARLLAPDFGTGLQVWGSIIGVFLLALSGGYYLGGRLSSRWPVAGGLSALILVCSLLMAALPLVHKHISGALFTWWVLDRGGAEQWGALAAAVALFLVPSGLLGTVSPYAIRLAATDVDSVGEKAGGLYAVSTIGSFLGCMMTSFYFILWMGVRAIILTHAAVLFVASLAFWGAWTLLSRRGTGVEEEA